MPDTAAAQKKAEGARQGLFNQIETALRGAKSIEQFQTAWSLTSGKKTRLGGDYFTQLESIKDSLKAKHSP